ncbi:hypothetical protein BX616_000315 [Lobosporangium transversale]|nr:hypothetical protein BX616_000315 [Lobosporangium transversale]
MDLLLAFVPQSIIECLPLVLATVIYELQILNYLFFDHPIRPLPPDPSLSSVAFLPWEIPTKTRTWQGIFTAWTCSVIWFFSELTLNLLDVVPNRVTDQEITNRGISVKSKNLNQRLEHQQQPQHLQWRQYYAMQLNCQEQCDYPYLSTTQRKIASKETPAIPSTERVVAMAQEERAKPCPKGYVIEQDFGETVTTGSATLVEKIGLNSEVRNERSKRDVILTTDKNSFVATRKAGLVADNTDKDTREDKLTMIKKDEGTIKNKHCTIQEDIHTTIAEEVQVPQHSHVSEGVKLFEEPFAESNQVEQRGSSEEYTVNKDTAISNNSSNSFGTSCMTRGSLLLYKEDDSELEYSPVCGVEDVHPKSFADIKDDILIHARSRLDSPERATPTFNAVDTLSYTGTQQSFSPTGHVEGVSCIDFRKPGIHEQVFISRSRYQSSTSSITEPIIISPTIAAQMYSFHSEDTSDQTSSTAPSEYAGETSKKKKKNKKKEKRSKKRQVNLTNSGSNDDIGSNTSVRPTVDLSTITSRAVEQEFAPKVRNGNIKAESDAMFADVDSGKDIGAAKTSE